LLGSNVKGMGGVNNEILKRVQDDLVKIDRHSDQPNPAERG